MKMQHVKLFHANVKNGSVDAFFEGKRLEYLTSVGVWSISNAVLPDFDLFEYRVYVPKYRPFTPKEAVDYLGFRVYDCKNNIYTIAGIHSDYVSVNYEVIESTEISYETLLRFKFQNIDKICGVEV